MIKFVSTWLSSQAIDNSTKLHSQCFTHFKEKKKLERPLAQFLTPEIYIRGMRLSFRRNDFWDRLREQALVMIGRWYSRATINQSEETIFHPNDRRNRCLKFELILLIVSGVGNSPQYSFWSGEFSSV